MHSTWSVLVLPSKHTVFYLALIKVIFVVNLLHNFLANMITNNIRLTDEIKIIVKNNIPREIHANGRKFRVIAIKPANIFDSNEKSN